MSGLTTRTLVLIAFAVLALTALVPSLNQYMAQQQQLRQLQDRVAAQEQQVQQLEADIAKWEDPTFVAAQARERLLFAWPGETQYRLTDTSGKEVPLTEAQQAEQQAAAGSWYGTMWDSLVGASQAGVPSTPKD